MAMIKCSECEKNVSETATSCPHCGKQDPTGKLFKRWQQKNADEAASNTISKIITGIIICIIILVLASFKK